MKNKETRLILKIRKHFNSLVSQHQSNYVQHVSRDIKINKRTACLPISIVNYFPQCDHKNSTPGLLKIHPLLVFTFLRVIHDDCSIFRCYVYAELHVVIFNFIIISIFITTMRLFDKNLMYG